MAVPTRHGCTVQTTVEFCATDNNITLYGSTVSDNIITLNGSNDPALLYSTDCCGVLIY
jgi:hypothetical protein